MHRQDLSGCWEDGVIFTVFSPVMHYTLHDYWGTNYDQSSMLHAQTNIFFFSITFIHISSFAQHVLSNISDIVSRWEIRCLWCIVRVAAAELRSKSAGLSESGISFTFRSLFKCGPCLMFKPFKKITSSYLTVDIFVGMNGACVNPPACESGPRVHQILSTSVYPESVDMAT